MTISSFAGAIPSPLLATYSASKAFLQTWSDALQAELRGTGVDVESVMTYFVVCLVFVYNPFTLTNVLLRSPICLAFVARRL